MKNFKVPFGYKIALSFIIISFVFSFNFALADSCDELRPVLNKYYQASQEENIEAYMEVMDADYLRENLLDNYEDYVRAAWEVYDTKEYTIENFNCKMEESDALMYFNLKTKLLSEGQEVETQRNYIALFQKIDAWKIRYVMDEDVFSQFQSSLHSQLFLDATKEELIKSVENAEAIVNYAQIEKELLSSDYENTVSEGLAARSSTKKDEKNNSSFLTIIFAIFIIGALGFFLKNKYFKKN